MISSICYPVSLVLSFLLLRTNAQKKQKWLESPSTWQPSCTTVETVICFPPTIRPRVGLHAVGVHLLHSFQKRNSFLLWTAFWFSNPLTRKYCNYEIRFRRDSESQGFEILFWASLIVSLAVASSIFCFRAVKDPRDGKQVALKKMPNVFHNLMSAKRVLRELKMLCYFQHENVSAYSCFLNISCHNYKCLERQYSLLKIVVCEWK